MLTAQVYTQLETEDLMVDVQRLLAFSSAASSQCQLQKLLATDSSGGSYLGMSVDVSQDFAIAGAPWESSLGPSTGAAYVWERAEAGWVEVAKLTGSDALAYDFF